MRYLFLIMAIALAVFSVITSSSVAGDIYTAAFLVMSFIEFRGRV